MENWLNLNYEQAVSADILRTGKDAGAFLICRRIWMWTDREFWILMITPSFVLQSLYSLRPYSVFPSPSSILDG
jgi:hypothetical protein